MPTVVAFRAGVEVDRVVGLKKPAELLSWLEGVQRGETGTPVLQSATQYFTHRSWSPWCA